MPVLIEVQLSRLAASQYGLVRRQQLLELGISARTLSRRLEEGRLESLHERVYRLPGAPNSWHQRLLAACFWGGSTAVVSHLAAAQLWGLDGLEPHRIGERLEVTLSSRSNARLPGVVVHRSRSLSIKDRALYRKIPVTNIPRTLIDLAAVLDDKALERAVESALRWRPHLADWLRGRLYLLGGKGRKGVGRLERLLGDRDHHSDRPESDLEVRLRRALADDGLPPPVMQYTVLNEQGVHVATLDFAYPEARVGIEADGKAFHWGHKAFERDRSKLSELAGLGWRVVHATHFDLERRPGRIAEQVRRAMASRARTSDTPAAAANP